MSEQLPSPNNESSEQAQRREQEYNEAQRHIGESVYVERSNGTIQRMKFTGDVDAVGRWTAAGEEPEIGADGKPGYPTKALSAYTRSDQRQAALAKGFRATPVATEPLQSTADIQQALESLNSQPIEEEDTDITHKRTPQTEELTAEALEQEALLEDELLVEEKVGESAVEAAGVTLEEPDEQVAEAAAETTPETPDVIPRNPTIKFELTAEQKEAMRREAERPGFFGYPQLSEIQTIITGVEQRQHLSDQGYDAEAIKGILRRDIVSEIDRVVQQARNKQLTPESYIVETSMLLGASPEPSLIDHIESSLIPSGVYSQEDLQHLHENMGHLKDILYRSTTDEEKWGYFGHLEAKARHELERHDNVPTREYLETVGLMMGFGSRFTDFNRRYAATSQAFEALRRAKQPRPENE